MAHYTDEPVGYTCHIIDSVQQQASQQHRVLDAVIDQLNPVVNGDLLSNLDNVANWLEKLAGSHKTTELEQVRRANTLLREWGHENAQARQKLEDEAADLKEEIVELQKQLHP